MVTNKRYQITVKDQETGGEYSYFFDKLECALERTLINLKRGGFKGSDKYRMLIKAWTANLDNFDSFKDFEDDL